MKENQRRDSRRRPVLLPWRGSRTLLNGAQRNAVVPNAIKRFTGQRLPTTPSARMHEGTDLMTRITQLRRALLKSELAARPESVCALQPMRLPARTGTPFITDEHSFEKWDSGLKRAILTG